MSGTFLSFPQLNEEMIQKSGFFCDSFSFTYEDSNETFNLQIKDDESILNGSIVLLQDERCIWAPDVHNLNLEFNLGFAYAYQLFGENGVAPDENDSSLGLALKWISTESDSMGIIDIGELRSADSIKKFKGKFNSKQGILKGSIIFQVILYVKSCSTNNRQHINYANMPGINLGTLFQFEAVIDGNGSMFPIVYINAPGKPLSEVFYNPNADPFEDKFESGNVEIRINQAHPAFEQLGIGENMSQSLLFNEVLANSLFVIIQAVKDSAGVDWDKITGDEFLGTGTIAEAIRYFVTKLNWDISSPTQLSMSIKEFFDDISKGGSI